MRSGAGIAAACGSYAEDPGEKYSDKGTTNVMDDPGIGELSSAGGRSRTKVAILDDMSMTKLFGFIGATIGSAIGWWLGNYVGIMTAVILSMVGTGVGIYYGKRYGDHLSGG